MNPAASSDERVTEAYHLHRAGRLAEAEAAYRRILQREPKNSRTLYLLGTLRLQQNDLDEAVRLTERAIQIQPGVASMHSNLAAIYRARKQPAQAVQAAEKATVLAPDSAEAFFNLGHALRDLGDLARAAEAYRRYLALKPNDPEALTVLGDTLRLAGRLHEAMGIYETALAFTPDNPTLLLSIADLFEHKGWMHAAREVTQRAAQSGDPEARRNAGLRALQFGDLAAGWRDMEGRFESQTQEVQRRPEPPAAWRGEDLAGKNILIWTEQGLGDEILYAGMIPQVISGAKRCFIECSKRLVPILARSFPAADVAAWDKPDTPPRLIPGLDYQIAGPSLGQFLRKNFSNFPAHGGYLKADPAKVAALRARYQERAGGRKIVGLSWHSTNAIAGANKSARLSSFAPLLTVPGCMFVSLQYGDHQDELAQVNATLGVDVISDPEIDPLGDMDGFFAQVAAMDLVITTSNTTAHVAGAQNIPAWILLPFAFGSVWYWFLRRNDSPWYPSVRLFRGHRDEMDGHWEIGPIARAAEALAAAPPS